MNQECFFFPTSSQFQTLKKIEYVNVGLRQEIPFFLFILLLRFAFRRVLINPWLAGIFVPPLFLRNFICQPELLFFLACLWYKKSLQTIMQNSPLIPLLAIVLYHYD